ncbi:MAG: arylesterase [Acidobacteria bacterium]|nr:arylesterase [Acidobacteriota bacterium]
MLLAAGCGTKVPAPVESEPAPAPSPRVEAKDDRPVVLAFGDSLSAGYGVETGLSYPDFLQKEIDAKGFKYRVVNQGISGDTTSGGLARLSQGLETKPYLVILELGGNDGLRGLPLTVTRDNLDKMTAAFKESGAKVVIAGMTLPRNYGADYIKEFEQIYPGLEKKHRVTRMRFLLEGVAMNPALMQRDEIHPNAEGNKIVARNVMKVIEPLLKK